jgi:hypothetical protein
MVEPVGSFGASARLPKGQAAGSERPGHHVLGLDEEDDPAGSLRVRTTRVERRDPVDSQGFYHGRPACIESLFGSLFVTQQRHGAAALLAGTAG